MRRYLPTETKDPELFSTRNNQKCPTCQNRRVNGELTIDKKREARVKWVVKQ